MSDTSLQNPLTLLQGLYAALAARDEETVAVLARMPVPESTEYDASPPLITTLTATQAAALGDRAGAARIARDGRREDGDDASPYGSALEWLIQWGTGTGDDLQQLARRALGV